jgi:hypothetical protein
MADQQRGVTGRLNELLEAWEFELREDPLFATSVGGSRTAPSRSPRCRT